MDTAVLTLDEAISDCIMNTTDFNLKTNSRILSALVNQTGINGRIDYGSDRGSDPMSYALTGSVAELTIKTPLPCFGDSDFMIRCKRYMVIPLGTAFPTKEHMRKYESRELNLCSYRKTEFPAYVRLCYLGTLSFDKEADSVDFVPYTHPLPENYFDSVLRLDMTDQPPLVHGPATAFEGVTIGFEYKYHEINSFKSMDMVPCLFCPHWPPEARDFCDRSRQHGWPTRSTIEEVVSLGCDFVKLPHPLHRKSEIKTHWRFSFSRAEIILIHTWSNSQKIVYHLLRYLNKNTHIFKDHVICTYHLKTLMLWNCEKRPPEYWNCQRLMHIVADMLSELKQCVQWKRLQNYFIPDCNLMLKNCTESDDDGSDNIDDIEPTSKRLSSFEVSDLIDWFLRNYLFVVAAKCPENESGMMVKYLEIMNFPMNYNTWAKTFAESWVKTFAESLISDYVHTVKLFEDVESSICMIYGLYGALESQRKSCRNVLQMLHQVDGRLIHFFRAFILLNAAETVQEAKQLPNHWLVAIMLDVVIDFEDSDNSIWEFLAHEDYCDTAKSSFNMALFILRMMVDRKESDANVLLLELAKSCFRKSLQCSDSLAISSAAVVYLAMISYEQRLYEEAIDLCVLVIERSCVPEMGGIRSNRDLIKQFDLPYLSAFVGFTDLISHQYVERKTLIKTDAIEYPPLIIASMLLKDILDSCGSSVSNFGDLEETLIAQLQNDNCRRHKIKNIKQSQGNSVNGHINRLILNIVAKSAKKFGDFQRQRKAKQKIVIYSRCSVPYLPKISDGLSDSLLDLSARYLTAFQKSVMEDLEPLKYCVITDQYMMLHYFRCGDYVSALEISDQVIARYIQDKKKIRMPFGIYHTIVLPPLHMLLDDQLKMFIDETGPLCVRFIDTKVVALYIKSECLLKLGKPVFYFFRVLLMLRDCAENETAERFLLSAEIARHQLEKLLHIFSDRIRFLPNGGLKFDLPEKEIFELLDTPDIAVGLKFEDVFYND